MKQFLKITERNFKVPNTMIEVQPSDTHLGVERKQIEFHILVLVTPICRLAGI